MRYKIDGCCQDHILFLIQTEIGFESIGQLSLLLVKGQQTTPNIHQRQLYELLMKIGNTFRAVRIEPGIPVNATGRSTPAHRTGSVNNGRLKLP